MGKKKKDKKLGYRFWSHYLDSYCTVVFYLSDNHWWFKAESGTLKGRLVKAGTPLSYFIKRDKELNIDKYKK